ncbi:MAG: maleylpyruvate isomerase family mycothiol-dependent enzyme [Nakamurella sp.]
MDTDELWRRIHHNRAVLADQLETLTPAEWETPSLCAGWTVRDVAAHVISSSAAGFGEVMTAMARARFNFNRCMDDMAKRRSARPTEEIIADYRRLAGSRRRPPGTSRFDPLVDVLIHTQDIVRPLGRRQPMPDLDALAVAGYVWGKSFPYGAQRRLRGVRLSATDVDWTVGEGAPVEGPVSALLLLMTGRTASLPELSGAGVTRLTVS